MPKKECSSALSTRAPKSTTWQTLGEFMRHSMNSVSREAILTRRVLYDLSIAAAHGGYALDVFAPDVDRNGVDVVLSDADRTVPVQLKATVNPLGPGSKFKYIHAGVLRPHIHVAEHLGFEPGQFGTGQAGAVVAIEATLVPASPTDPDAPPRVDLRYWVTSAEILVALREGYVADAPDSAAKAAEALIQELHRKTSHERVDVGRRCFVPAVSPGAVLTLLGLHSHLPFRDHQAWEYNLSQALKRPTADELARYKTVAESAPGKSARDVEECERAAHRDQVGLAFQACVAWPKRGRSARRGAASSCGST